MRTVSSRFALGAPRRFGSLVVCLTAACTGTIAPAEDPVSPGGGATGSTGTSGRDPAPAAAEDCRESVLPARRIWRLNDRQVRKAVADLLPGVKVPAIATPGRSDYEFISRADRFPIDGQMASVFQSAARAVATQVAATPSAFVVCGGKSNDACARDFITGFASRAFRRKLTDDDQAALMKLYAAGAASGFGDGISLVVEGVLQSADFLYRTELGDATASLTSEEIAGQLSFLLLDSVPDAELWQAAERGDLSQPAGRRAQVERLLTAPAVRDNVSRILGDWLGTAQVSTVETDAAELTDDLRASIRADMDWLLRSLVERNAPVSELFVSRASRPDARVAALYGATPATGSTPVTLDARWTGVLARPGLVATLAPTNRSVHRGVFVLKQVLCRELTPPPPTLDTSSPLRSATTERERVAVRASLPTCTACHAQIDPLGLSFEHYDAIGRYVAEREGEPVDASGTLLGTDVDGPFADVVDLEARFARSNDVAACLGAQLMGYALGQPSTSSACADSQPAAGPETGLLDLVRQIALSPATSVRSSGGVR